MGCPNSPSNCRVCQFHHLRTQKTIGYLTHQHLLVNFGCPVRILPPEIGYMHGGGTPPHRYKLDVAGEPFILAGRLGFEPRQADPESAVLPLHYLPIPSNKTLRAVSKPSRGRVIPPSQTAPRRRYYRLWRRGSDV